jgi:hypothetical protein
VGYGPKPSCAAIRIDGVLWQEFGAALHQIAQPIATGSARIFIDDRQIGQIMGRSRLGIVRERRSRPGGATVEEQIAVADSGHELPRFRSHGGLHRFEQASALVRGDVTCGEVDHDLVLDGHRVAANRPVVGAELNSAGCGFDGRTSGEVSVGIVSEQRHVCDFATRRQVGRRIVRYADEPLAGNRIHRRQIGGLQGSFSTERFDR